MSPSDPNAGEETPLIDPTPPSDPNAGEDTPLIDTTPPVIEDAFLTLIAVEVDDGRIKVSWQPAEDDFDSADELTYEIYYSDSSNLDGIANMKKNGQGKHALIGVTSHEFTGLTIDKAHYFGVIVRDKAGNESSYSMRSPFCGGTGVNGDEFNICDPGSLQFIFLHLDKHYKVTKDINLSSTKDWNAGAGWKPIGPFKGVFDGTGKVIDKLFMTDLGAEIGPMGLFSSVDAAEIFNLTITNAFVHANANDYSGILVGFAESSVFENCHVLGVLESKSFSGGLLGYESEVTVLLSSAAVDIDAHNDGTSGGLIGKLVTNSTIEQSFASGNVVESHELGGFIGDARESVITDSYASGHVIYRSGSGDNVGGFIGDDEGDLGLSRVYALGNVVGNVNVGGLIGRSSTNGPLSHGFAIGNVTTSSATSGALIGGLIYTNSFTNAFWLNQPFNKGRCYASSAGVAGNANCTEVNELNWFHVSFRQACVILPLPS